MNLNICYSQLPSSIIAIYTNVIDTPYAIINDKLNSTNKQFIKHACEYLHIHNSHSHILQFEHLSELDYEAFQYASNLMKGYNINGDVI